MTLFGNGLCLWMHSLSTSHFENAVMTLHVILSRANLLNIDPGCDILVATAVFWETARWSDARCVFLCQDI